MDTLDNAESQVVMIYFTEQQERFNWRISNDGVMGGKSQGQLLFKQDHVLFTGNISLANNGGFSSAFRTVEPLSPDIGAITVDIAGDGHHYQFRVATNINGQRLYYFHEVSTEAGQRHRLRFELADFQATFRGRKIPNAPAIKPEHISEVGFLLTAKQARPFSLSMFAVDFIKMPA
ncbi:MAG: CIA30 family protein [Moritella sp.]|uniref:CIA30 family protein n=1 Tax=Moritella sp. TaxID=78556 RepID=UPI0029ACCE1F|nr:CIA30 family protein [Moritella sp.]MDX2319560.1 CIA30 family protein [Moritella sp.]